MVKDTLAFRITALYRDFLSYTTRELKRLGLSFGQIPVILYTGKHPGCPQADLTRDMKLDWGYSQRTVSKLVEAGFMTKEYDESQACNCLDLTEKGKQAFEVSHQVFYDWDEKRMQSFTTEEKETVMKLLSRIGNKEADHL